MHRVTVLMTQDTTEDLAPFLRDDLEVRFHRWHPASPLPLLDGDTYAFVDWLLSDMPGVEMCRRLRCNPQTAKSHIVMVLEEDDREARRRALAAGADDYMIGPATRNGMLDRILKRDLSELGVAETGKVTLGNLVVDLAAHQARWKGKPIGLMPNDLRLLRYFIEHPGQVFTRNQLIAALGKHGDGIDERTVDVWVGRLRRALRGAGVAANVRTVRSLGYIFDRP